MALLRALERVGWFAKKPIKWLVKKHNMLCAPICLLLLTTLSSAAWATFSSSNLPIIFIDTNGQEIRNSVRISANMGVIDNGSGRRNHINDAFNNYDGFIAIEIRGSSGQWKNWPKKQYGFETQSESGENRNVALLRLPEENDWILYPPYSDKSLMRNVLAYHLSNDMGRYAAKTRFCELVLNGDYQGVYVLIEKIKRDVNRINIAKLRPEDVEGDQLTGGYIIKVDRRAGEENEGWVSPYREWAKGDVEWLYHDPGPDELTSHQKEYIKNYVIDFETTMQQADWQIMCERYLDVEAFIDYYLLNELALNIDTYTFSTFFSKDRDSKGGRLTIGPLWDFNLAYGNADYFIGYQTEGWLLGTKIEVHDRIPFWLKNLYDSPDIQQRIADRWQSLRTHELALDRILSLVDSYVDTLAEAQVRNFARWPILGEYIWPNYFVGDTHEEEIGYLKEWLTKRWRWMDGQLLAVVNVKVRNVVPNVKLQQNYPNPFNQFTWINYQLAVDGYVDLVIVNALGQRVRRLIHNSQSAGDHAIHWDGLTEENTRAPSGLYFIVLTVNESTTIQKMILLP